MAINDRDKDLLKQCEAIDSEGEESMKTRRQDWRRAVRLYRTGAPDKQDATQVFRANLIGPNTRRMTALQTETKPIIDVRPRRDGLTTTAELLKKTIHAGWDELHVGLALEDLALYARVFSSAFVYIGWDSDADYGLGNICIKAEDPRQKLVDPAIRHARDLDKALYIRTRGIVPLDAAQRRFPDVASRLKPSGKITLTDEDEPKRPQGLIAKIRGAVESNGLSPRANAIPRIELFEYWVRDEATDKDDNPKWPGGKIIVRANDDVICDERPNPYYDGLWPWEWLDNSPDLDTAWGRDELEAVRFLQSVFNKLGNNFVSTYIKNSAVFVICDQNALEPEAVKALQDAGLWVIQKTPGREVRREASPMNPGTALQFMQYAAGLIDNVEGLADSSGNIGTSRGRAEVRSASMLEGLQQASQVLVRAQARRLEALLERMGQKWCSRIFQFWNADRFLYYAQGNKIEEYKFERAKLVKELLEIATKQLLRARERQQADEENAEPIDGITSLGDAPVVLPVLTKEMRLAALKGAWREFTMKIVPMSSLGASRIARAQVLGTLNDKGLIPSTPVLEEAGIENPGDMFNKAIEERHRMAAAGIAPPGMQPKKKSGGSK